MSLPFVCADRSNCVYMYTCIHVCMYIQLGGSVSSCMFPGFEIGFIFDWGCIGDTGQHALGQWASSVVKAILLGQIQYIMHRVVWNVGYRSKAQRALRCIPCGPLASTCSSADTPLHVTRTEEDLRLGSRSLKFASCPLFLLHVYLPVLVADGQHRPL